VGMHAGLPCTKCHQPKGSEILSLAEKRFCFECHADPHRGEFAAEPHNNNCELCHSETGFASTTFSVERHEPTRFPLTGRHAEVECLKCHRGIPGASKAESEPAVASSLDSLSATIIQSSAPDARLQFRFASQACSACHKDPHGLNPVTNLSCEACHTPQQWGILLPFDHSRTQARLEGAHKEAASTNACRKCHGASKQGAPVFSGVSIQCSECHANQDPHGGQFNSPGNEPRDCASCHVPASWTTRAFDHNRTQFALTGAHIDASCAKCHKEQKEADGRIARLYRGTPTDCVKCH
jgi:hypothetical protein